MGTLSPSQAKKRDMPWVPFLFFYLGVLAFTCSGVLFIWYISNHQEEIDFDDIDIPLSTSLLLSCALFCLGICLHPRYIKKAMLTPGNRTSSTELSPRMDNNNILT